jgi:hypothetical protein
LPGHPEYAEGRAGKACPLWFDKLTMTQQRPGQPELVKGRAGKASIHYSLTIQSLLTYYLQDVYQLHLAPSLVEV